MKLNVVGKNIIRVDAYSKVTGSAIYPQDIYFDDMLYAKTLRSEKPHANIMVDIEEAEKVEGVVKVFTYKDVPKENIHGVVLKDHEVFASKKVIRIGEPIAFIVGETQKACEEGLKKIKVHYEEIPAVFDPIEAMKEDAPKVHGDTNIVFSYKLRHGDIEEGKKKCKYIVENTYKSPMVEHVFLQPEAGLGYIEEDGTVVVAVATQYPHYDREEIAINLGLPEEKVKVINTAVGGAFGAREDISPQIHLALAAYVLRRPVKVIYSREESFLSHSKRHPMIMKYKTGADENGMLQYMEAEIIGDSGAHCSWAINVLRKAGVHATGPYYIPNVKVDTCAVATNNPFTGAMRGFGATQVPIAYEQQMDILAEKLEMDPIEFRMKNIFRKGSMTATGQILTDSVPLDKCLEATEEDFKFGEQFRKVKEHNAMKKKGIGVGVSFYGTGYGNGFPDISNANIKLLPEGKIGIYCGVTEVGQGAKTAMKQIGAEVLGLTVEDIELIHEDTSLMPDSGTAAATRQTYNTGNAIKIACENMKNELFEKARVELGLNSTVGLALEKGEVVLSFFPQKRISYKELSNRYKDESTIKSSGTFTAQTTEMDPETGQGAPYWPYTFNACAVEVEVDINTGVVRLLRSTFAQDAGRAVNPNILEGQMDGGFAMALGYALFEDLNLENGRMKNNKLSKYLIPTAMDMIDVKNIIVEDPESTAPYGAKGIGEPVMIPIAPAILNAVYNAIGIRIKELPITPEKLMKAIRDNS